MRNPLKARIAARKASLGLLVTIPSVPVVQVLARSGFDCLLIDLEHAPMDMPSVHALIAATAGTSAAPLVRVPWNLAWLAKPALDVGAAGIAFPMVNSRSEAEAAVAAVRYPPAGRRNWGPFSTHHSAGTCRCSST